jgi:hypothetical protein
MGIVGFILSWLVSAAAWLFLFLYWFGVVSFESTVSIVLAAVLAFAYDASETVKRRG